MGKWFFCGLFFALLRLAESNSPIEKITIRVNTFRRSDLLRLFLDHYITCPNVLEIQVVWSDVETPITQDWHQRYPSRVVFEWHDKDSLSNRFFATTQINTEGVLSIDDDLVIPCESLQSLQNVWSANRGVLVGVSPRMHAFDVDTGEIRYLRWQHVWWNGFYSIMLTKASMLHRNYFDSYKNLMSKFALDYIDKHKNCEDLAMAFVVATESRAPPVWVQSVVYETGNSGISSNVGHFMDRSACLTFLRNTTGRWPWVTAYQKAVPLSHSIFDYLRLWFDRK